MLTAIESEVGLFQKNLRGIAFPETIGELIAAYDRCHTLAPYVNSKEMVIRCEQPNYL